MLVGEMRKKKRELREEWLLDKPGLIERWTRYVRALVKLFTVGIEVLERIERENQEIRKIDQARLNLLERVYILEDEMRKVARELPFSYNLYSLPCYRRLERARGKCKRLLRFADRERFRFLLLQIERQQ